MPAILLLSNWSIIPSFTQEICLFDNTLTTTVDEHGFHFFTVGEELPENWIEPFNYFEGTFHFRYEIIDYPSTEPFAMSVCIWSDVKLTPEGKWETWRETCSTHLPIPGPGTFTTHTIPSTWWLLHNDLPVDFTRINDFERLGIVFWCADRKNLSDWVPKAVDCWQQRALLLPMKLHVSIVAVAKGYEFSGWHNY